MSIREQVMRQAQGALMLQVAFIGVTNGLLSALHREGPMDSMRLAESTNLDLGYLVRWCDAAYAFELLTCDDGIFALDELGAAFVPEVPGTLMPLAIQAALSAHMAEHAAIGMRTGERPGEGILAQRSTIGPWFGPMLQSTFGALFETQILPQLEIYREIDARNGMVLDLGCGNGWYLRALARHLPNLLGVGLDAMASSIDHASAKALEEGLQDRLTFRGEDITSPDFTVRADIIAMNRALHHVWADHESVLPALVRHLNPGGAVVIWEPLWPDSRQVLRDPAMRGLAFNNLSEHVQGNHFLRPADVTAALQAQGLTVTVHPFVEGREVVYVARMPR